METWMRGMLIALGVILFVIGFAYAIRIEQIAGYYECAKCHEKSWQKKRISKD